jgi:hypothetical protein
MPVKKLPKHIEVLENRAAAKHANKSEKEIIQETFPQMTDEVFSFLEQSNQTLRPYTNLKLENQIYCIFGLAWLQYFRVHGFTNEHQQTFCAAIQLALSCKQPTDKRIEKYLDSEPLKFVTTKEVFPSYDIYQSINKEIEKISLNLHTKYHYIERINEVKLGNIFKLLHLAQRMDVKSFVGDQIKELDELISFLKNPRSHLKSNSLINYYIQISQSHLSQAEMQFWGMTELELAQYKCHSVEKIERLIAPRTFTDSIKDCIKFTKPNEKGVASILYSLFQIISPNCFPTKEELETIKPDLTLNSNDWAQHKLRSIQRIIDIDYLIGKDTSK